MFKSIFAVALALLVIEMLIGERRSKRRLFDEKK